MSNSPKKRAPRSSGERSEDIHALSHILRQAPFAVDAKRLSELLSLSVRTVRSMDAAGKLPKPVKLNGRSVRWLPKEIEEWLQAGTPDRQTWEVLRKNGRHEG